MYICTCTKCGNIYHDTNPQTGNIYYREILEIGELVVMEDEEPEDYMHACPICLTDGYLSDNICDTSLNEEACKILENNNFSYAKPNF